MPPRQNTFTLVPNPLGMQGLMARPTTGPESKPPMTSKQAQKLYKQATRQPRLSKAEQRRIELEEQARIRKELDKEKQANKARLLREKKKAKEQQILEEKRRKGLPLVDVRPSQDTISRFVRGNGMGKKRDATGAKVGLPAVQEEESDKVPPKEAEGDGGSESKRPRLDNTLPANSNRVDRVDAQEVPPPKPPGSPHKTAKPPETRIAAAQRSTQGRSASPSTNSTRARERAAGEEPTAMLTAGEKTGPEGKQRPENKEGWDGRTTPGDTTGEGKPNPEAARVHLKVHEVIQHNSAKETPTSAPSRPILRQDTPDRCVSDHERPVPWTRERKLNETPATKALDPSRLPTTNRPPIPPPQRHASPNSQPAQRPAARKPLQDATDALNQTTRPLAVGDKASKFASPYKQPAFSTPRQQIPRAAPAFKQTRPQTPTSGAPKPQFLPPHLRQQTPSAAPTNKHKQANNNFMTAPPTSTQLFVMSHIDDILPSPSQEARELRGDALPAVVEPPKPPPLRPPIAATRPTRQLTPQTTHITLPMAPPPPPLTAKPAAVDPTDLPFISTQDLILSSQDLRDVEAPTPSRTTGARGPNMPPFKKDRATGQLRPSPLSHSSSHDASPLQARAKHSIQAAKQQPSLAAKQHSTPPTVTRRPEQACRQQSCASKQGPGHKSKHTSQNSRPASPPCPGRVTDGNRAFPDVPPRRECAEKPRFFGSSGVGMETLLAMERSRKTHEEEEKRRRAQREAQPNSVGTELAPDSHEATSRASGHESAKVQGRKAQEEQGQPTRPQLVPPQTEKSGREKTIEEEPVTEGQPDAAAKTASQETDYGDIELDSIDFDELDLDSVASKPQSNKPKDWRGSAEHWLMTSEHWDCQDEQDLRGGY